MTELQHKYIEKCQKGEWTVETKERKITTFLAKSFGIILYLVSVVPSPFRFSKHVVHNCQRNTPY